MVFVPLALLKGFWKLFFLFLRLLFGKSKVYTKVFYEHPSDGGVFAQKVPLLRTWTKENPLVEIDDDIAPHQNDCIIVTCLPPGLFW